MTGERSMYARIFPSQMLALYLEGLWLAGLPEI